MRASSQSTSPSSSARGSAHVMHRRPGIVFTHRIRPSSCVGRSGVRGEWIDRERVHQRSGDVRAFVSRVGDERDGGSVARVGRRRARCDSNQARLGFVATAGAVATSRARRARSTRRVAGWWPTRRARFDLMTASNTAVTTRSSEIAGAPRDAPHAVRRDSTRNRAPDRDEGDPRRVISTPACAARCGGDGRLAALRRLSVHIIVFSLKPNQLPAKIDVTTTGGGRVTFSEETLFFTSGGAQACPRRAPPPRPRR